MPIDHRFHLYWERVFIYRFRDPWTWEDLMLTFDLELQYSRSLPADEQYITLIDILHAKSMTPGLSLFHFYYMQRNDPPNWDCMIIVRDKHRFFNPLLMVANAYPGWHNRVFMVDTMAEAEKIIRERRRDSTG